jgi:hypothetical protein
MKHRNILLTRLWLTLAMCVCMTFVAGNASAQLVANQTQGFGNGKLVTFTYLQNFDCVDQPTMDLDFNGVKAQSDPNEMQTPICQAVTEPTANPAGGDIKHTAHLYVLIPMFSVDNDQNPADAMPEWREAWRTLRSRAGTGVNRAIRCCTRGLEGQSQSGHHDAVPRPEQSRARHVHHARFLSRPVRDAGGAR